MAVWPKKGDAITWYNMHRNGWQDKLMAHGGCPVIKGINMEFYKVKIVQIKSFKITQVKQADFEFHQT